MSKTKNETRSSLRRISMGIISVLFIIAFLLALKPVSAQENSDAAKAKEDKKAAFERKVHAKAKKALWDPKNADVDEDTIFARVGKEFNLSGKEVLDIYRRLEMALTERFGQIQKQAQKQLSILKLKARVLSVIGQPANFALVVKTQMPTNVQTKDLKKSSERDALMIIRLGLNFPEVQEVQVWTVAKIDSAKETKVFSITATRDVHEKNKYNPNNLTQSLKVFKPWYHPKIK